MPPSAPPPLRSAAAPSLPYDIIHRIALDAVDDAFELEDRETGRAVSLVCRDLRNVVQGLVWRVVKVPHLWLEQNMEKEEATRLLQMVRTLRWDEGIDLSRSGPRVQQSVQTFARLARALGGITKIEVVDLPSDHSTTLLSSIFASPSLSSIRFFSLVGFTSSLIDEGPLRQTELVDILRSFPALSAFNCQVSELASADPLPSDSPHLRLSSLRLGTDRNDDLPSCQPPSSPYPLFTSALDLSVLTRLAVRASKEEDGWLQWLSQPAFPSLQSLQLQSFDDCFAPSLPIYSSCLAFHPTLLRLELCNNGAVGIEEERYYPTFRAFLFSLPPTLHSLLFDFSVPTGEILDDYLQNGPSTNLWWFSCMKDHLQQFRLSWNPQTRRFEESIGVGWIFRP
ncbi:hypothetical protein JCM6882_007902 [Rhodosporidiobolus microsporus]